MDQQTRERFEKVINYIWRAGPPGGVMGDGIVLSASVLKEWLAKQDESAQREAGHDELAALKF
jgi:hypothetical protein